MYVVQHKRLHQNKRYKIRYDSDGINHYLPALPVLLLIVCPDGSF
jgi:hypothetical protein